MLTPTAAGFPWLAKLVGSSLFNQPNGATYTLQGDDIPYFLVHLDHQPRTLKLEVIDQSTGESAGFADIEEFLPRNSSATSFFAFTWDGTVMRRPGGKLRPVADGTYRIELTVLKALGDPGIAAHTEHWTSPNVTHRSALTPAGPRGPQVQVQRGPEVRGPRVRRVRTLDLNLEPWNLVRLLRLTDSSTLLRIVVAALGGAAIGVERQWSGHASGPRARFGGVRTFTLLGGVAGLAGWLVTLNFTGFAVVLAAGAVALVVAGYVAASRVDVDATTEAAALIVVGAGLAAGLGWLALASGIVAVTHAAARREIAGSTRSSRSWTTRRCGRPRASASWRSSSCRCCPRVPSDRSAASGLGRSGCSCCSSRA